MSDQPNVEKPVVPAEPKQSKTGVMIVVIIAVVLLVLCCCLALALFGIPAILAMLGPAVGNVFSDISENLITP